jgi:hypothetical protein
LEPWRAATANTNPHRPSHKPTIARRNPITGTWHPTYPLRKPVIVRGCGTVPARLR